MRRAGALRPIRGRRVLEKWGGAMSLAAAAVHGAVAPEHLEEWWGYGLFFITAGLAQAVLGLALLTDAVNERDAGARHLAMRHAMYALGIGGNAAIVALYALTRTTGIPAFGPDAGVVEAVGGADVLAGFLEIGVIAVLARLLARSRRGIE